MTATDRAAELRADRDEHTREQLAPPDAWTRVELPAWVRERWPGIDLTDPSTLPEPDRCAEGRPWGADPWGSAAAPDARWRSYVDGRLARPCRNRWRDRTTLLCGTHLNSWRANRLDAERRLRRVNAWAEATELARDLGRHGVIAEAGAAGIVLRPDDALELLRLLDHAAVHGLLQLARGTATPCDTPAPPPTPKGD